MNDQRYPLPPTSLATLQGTGGGYGGPVEPPASRDPVGEAFNWPGQSAGAGIAYDPFLARIYEKSEPIEKKFAITFDFPTGVETTIIFEKTLKTNDFPWLCTQYRWEWSGQPLTPQFTPIEIQYGSSNDVTIGRDTTKDDRELALIGAVWGSALEWVFPSRPRLWRPNRFISVKARLDYNLMVTGVPEDILPTRLDIIFEGLELRPRTS